MMTVRTLLTATLLVSTLAATASAQDFRAQPQGPGPRPPLQGIDNGDMTPSEIQKLFDAYLVMEAQQALELTDDQYPQFLTRLRVLQDTRRRNQQERFRLMGELQRLSAPRMKVVEEGALKERLAALQELESRTAAELRKAYSSVDEVLDLRQQARFRVFEEQIERRKLELLMRARQQNRPTQQQPGQRPQVRRPNPRPPA